jgi:hypothetical protein
VKLDDQEIFPMLEPPAGGLLALRARIARRPSRRRGALLVLAAGAACALLLAARPRRPPPAFSPAAVAASGSRHFGSMVALGLAGMPEEPVTAIGGRVHLSRVPTSSSTVVLYLPSRRE